jgi:hypothetical protein
VPSPAAPLKKEVFVLTEVDVVQTGFLAEGAFRRPIAARSWPRNGPFPPSAVRPQRAAGHEWGPAPNHKKRQTPPRHEKADPAPAREYRIPLLSQYGRPDPHVPRRRRSPRRYPSVTPTFFTGGRDKRPFGGTL